MKLLGKSTSAAEPQPPSARAALPGYLLLGCLLLAIAAAPMARADTPVADTAGNAAAESLAETAGEAAATQEAPLQLVGEARLKVLLWSVYDSRLYTATGSYVEGQRPLRLEIDYLIDVPAENLVKRTAQEWEAMGRDHPEQARWLARLLELWPDIVTGDVIALQLDDANRATFYRNGELLGTVDDPDFGQHFVDIWLSPDTTRPELRLSLLGSED